jgi:hypothetical protein
MLRVTAPGSPLQGFPRIDVDIYRARSLRQEHIRLVNDHMGLMNELHAALTALHEAARHAGTATEGVRDGGGEAEAAGGGAQSCAAFAVITQVEVGSPAAGAGLNEGDRVVQVGDVASGPRAVASVAARLPVRHTCPSAHACLMNSCHADAVLVAMAAYVAVLLPIQRYSTVSLTTLLTIVYYVGNDAGHAAGVEGAGTAGACHPSRHYASTRAHTKRVGGAGPPRLCHDAFITGLSSVIGLDS